jgi:hypothetical protein
MRPIDATGWVTGTALKSVPAAVRASEKVSLYNRLDGNSQDDAPGNAGRGPQTQAPVPSRSGTNDFDPYWHGPRLRPAFVAQVLGQFFPGPAERAPSAAYGSELPQIARLLDDRA